MLKRLLGSLTSPQPHSQPRSISPTPAKGRFVTFALVGDAMTWVDPSVTYRLDQASARLRLIAPAKHLARAIRTALVPVQDVQRFLAGAQHGDLHALVITKLASADVVLHERQLKALLDWLDGPGAGLNVFADLADDYAALGAEVGDAFPAEYQRRLGQRCTLVVPCEALANKLATWAKRGLQVVEDPWESPRCNAPRTAPAERLRLLWFGNFGPTNFEPVLARLHAAVAAADRPATLEFICHQARGELAARLGRMLVERCPSLEFSFLAWSTDRTWRAIDECDIVLLPQDTASPWARVKSHNRLVEAIRGGRIAIASPIPSYVELQDFAWVGEDFAEGIRWVLSHPRDAETRVTAGQTYVENRFSPATIGRKWEAVLGLASPHPAEVRDPAVPLRLNLGCGDKILDGYVNVDVAASRAGKVPDVQCDLRELAPFADGAADEVMAIHVVEHFWRWEVLEVLREWVRVLKPGGRMVLECPNLLTACEELLRNPAQAAATDQAAQRTMWVLYGDPRWHDPLMTHRWNYTPQSLAALLEEAGLVNVRQEPAQFKLREPRDMRVVGEKPRDRR